VAITFVPVLVSPLMLLIAILIGRATKVFDVAVIEPFGQVAAM